MVMIYCYNFMAHKSMKKELICLLVVFVCHFGELYYSDFSLIACAGVDKQGPNQFGTPGDSNSAFQNE